MIAEGFDENDVIVVIEDGKIIEDYPEEDRCLISGNFQLSKRLQESLHVVVDYWSESDKIEWIDIVTAYIPRYPFWETPLTRGKARK